MVTTLLKSKRVRSAAETATMLMLARKALRSYVDRHQIEQWSAEGTKQVSWKPRVNIEDKKDHYVILADLAGVKLEDLTLNIAGDALIIEGKRPFPPNYEIGHSDIHEIHYGIFSRRIRLPEDAAKENIEAFFNNGMLEIHVPSVRTEIPAERIHVTVR